MHDDMVRLQVPFSKSLNLGLSIQDLVLVFSLRPGPLKFFWARSCLGSVKCPQLLLHSIFLDLKKEKIQTTMDRRTPVKYLALIFLAIYDSRMNVTWVHPTCTKGGTLLLKDQLTSLKSFACRIFTPSNARFRESKLRRKLLVGKSLWTIVLVTICTVSIIT